MDYSLPDKRKILENYYYYSISLYEATKQSKMGFKNAIISSDMKVIFYIKDIFKFELEAEIEKLNDENISSELILSHKLNGLLLKEPLIKNDEIPIKAFFNKKFPTEIYLLKIW